MKVYFGIFLLIVSFSSAQATSQFVQCELEIVDEHYTCTVISANVTNQNNSIQFMLTHLEGKNNSDVIAMRISHSFSGIIQIFHKQFLEKFFSLQMIVLQYVGMRTLAVNSFEKCDELVTISFHGNSLEIVPDKIFENCKKLRTLTLSFNNIRTISNQTFVGLENLEVLNLNSNFIETFSQNWNQNLTNLKELELSKPKNNLTYEPSMLQHLEHLEVINLDSWTDRFENIKSLIENRTNLKKISISNNVLTDISGFFNQFQVLESLIMDDCSINGIPNNALRGWPKLKEFSLNLNKIKSITKKMFEELGSLEVLKLGHNLIESLETKSFDIHFQLKELDLSGNKIKTLHTDVFKYQPNLEKLDISSNDLKTLVAGLFKNLQKLEVLDFSNNAIKRLSSISSGSFEFLTDISTSFNEIEEIQRNFFDIFPNLTKVNFEGNLCVDILIEDFQQINVTSVFGQCFDNFEGLTTTTPILPTTTISTPSTDVSSTTSDLSSTDSFLTDPMSSTTVETSSTDIPSSTTALISTDPFSTTLATIMKTTTTVMTTTTSYFVPSTPSSTQSTTSRNTITSSTMRSTTDLESTTKGAGIGNVFGVSMMVVIFGAVRNLVL